MDGVCEADLQESRPSVIARRTVMARPADGTDGTDGRNGGLETFDRRLAADFMFLPPIASSGRDRPGPASHLAKASHPRGFTSKRGGAYRTTAVYIVHSDGPTSLRLKQ